ncbi:hypothetical protein AB0I00_31780 [Streptomyces sp. NPDC050803]
MIETMTGVDPARTHALLVGIEEYDAQYRPALGAGVARLARDGAA